MTLQTTSESHDVWPDNEEVLKTVTFAGGVVAVVAEHINPYGEYRILFKPNAAVYGLPLNENTFQIGTCLSSKTVHNLLQTIACEFNCDYLDFVMTVRRIFGDDIKDVVDAIGVPDGIIAVVGAEAQNSYQLVHVSTISPTNALQTKTVILENMPYSNSWKDFDNQIRFCTVFFGPMYCEAMERHSESKNHWMHVPTYRFFSSTLDFYMNAGCIDTIHLLAQASSDIDYRNWEGNTALHTSTCPWYSTEISDALIAENASLIAKNINDESPLHVAILNNNSVAVSFFLEKGIDPNLYICNGNSLASFCELIDDDYEIGRMINVYLVKQAAIKAAEEIKRSALL